MVGKYLCQPLIYFIDNFLWCALNKASLYHTYREVLAGRSVLNMPDRVDWKACSVSKEEETKLANRFRENFEPFDFTADL